MSFHTFLTQTLKLHLVNTNNCNDGGKCCEYALDQYGKAMLKIYDHKISVEQYTTLPSSFYDQLRDKLKFCSESVNKYTSKIEFKYSLRIWSGCAQLGGKPTKHTYKCSDQEIVYKNETKRVWTKDGKHYIKEMRVQANGKRKAKYTKVKI